MALSLAANPGLCVWIAAVIDTCPPVCLLISLCQGFEGVMVVGIPQDFLSLLGTSDALQCVSHADYSCLASGFLKEPYQPYFQNKMFNILYQYPIPNLPRILKLDMTVKFCIKYFFSIYRCSISSKLLLRIVLSPRFTACPKTGTKLFKHFFLAS